VCRVGARICALPLEHVVEVMRVQPIATVEAAPAFVLGLAVIRGMPLPVVDLAHLLTGEGCTATRFVTLRVAERYVVLAVPEVLGTRVVDPGGLGQTPPLLDDCPNVRRSLGALDGSLCEILESARIIDEASTPLLAPGAPS
jgi:purine-binding chemotaxis protein CheW